MQSMQPLNDADDAGPELATLLNHIHGDHGQYIQLHGWVKAAQDALSLLRLRQGGGFVTRPRDIDQRVSMPATGAQEVDAGLVNLRGHGSEHDRQAATPTGPHGGNGTAAAKSPYCAKLAGPCPDGCATVQLTGCGGGTAGDCWRVKQPTTAGVGGPLKDKP